jgi:quaternary ammonium compound-resistance protein SugE
MAWVMLLAAGLIEIAWSQSIKPTQNFTRLVPTLLCFTLAAAGVYLLSRSMNTLPVGTAYAVFTGIGAVGAIALGILVSHDPVTPARMMAMALIVTGIVLARITNPG